MTLWIGNGAVLKKSSQWQFSKLRILKMKNYSIFNSGIPAVLTSSSQWQLKEF